MGFTASCMVTSLQSWHCGIWSRCCRRWLLKTRRGKGRSGIQAERAHTGGRVKLFSYSDSSHIMVGKAGPWAEVREGGGGFVSGTLFRAWRPIRHELPDTALPSKPGPAPAEHHRPVALRSSSSLLCLLLLPARVPSCKVHPDLLGQQSHHSCYRKPSPSLPLLELQPLPGLAVHPSTFGLLLGWGSGGKGWPKGGSCLPLMEQSWPQGSVIMQSITVERKREAHLEVPVTCSLVV